MQQPCARGNTVWSREMIWIRNNSMLKRRQRKWHMTQKKIKIKCSQLCKKRTYSNVAQEHKKDWTHRPQEEILCTTGNDRCLESEFLCRTTKTNQSHTMKTTSEQHGTNIEYFMVLLIPSPGINCMIADKYVQQVHKKKIRPPAVTLDQISWQCEICTVTDRELFYFEKHKVWFPPSL